MSKMDELDDFNEAEAVNWFKASAIGSISKLDLESVVQIARWKHKKMKSRESELLARVRELEGVLTDWIAFEDRSIAKDGPYVGKEITELIAQGRKALKQIEGG